MSFKTPAVQVPSLEISDIMNTDVKKNMHCYSKLFSELFFKHLTSETEVQIKNGALSELSINTLGRLEVEMHVLDYNTRIYELYRPWCNILSGSPITLDTMKYIDRILPDVITGFEAFIFSLQEKATTYWFRKDNQMCKTLCSNTHKVVNFTSNPVPPILDEMLSHGINFVPTVARNEYEILEIVENDLKASAIRFFRDNNQNYPAIDKKTKLQTILSQLMPSNSTDINFYCGLYDSYKLNQADFLNKINASHLKNYKNMKKSIPEGTILSISDKNLGPCLLPIQWYINQYQHQADIGGHVPLNISEQQCLVIMLGNIQTFRATLSLSERITLKSYFVRCNPNFRVGCMKLVPKIHKLKSPIDSESWKTLPSRPIRGAENCPINGYSIALCKLLQNMHKVLKQMYADGAFGMYCKFPVIMGCDEYTEKISSINYPKQSWGNVCILSSDFSDAYTKASLNDLQKSIGKIGNIIKWDLSKISLSQ